MQVELTVSAAVNIYHVSHLLVLTKSFDEISNTFWPLTAAVSFATSIQKRSFDQAGIYR